MRSTTVSQAQRAAVSPWQRAYGRLRDHVALDKATSQNERDSVRARLADRRLRLAQRLGRNVGAEFAIGQADAQPDGGLRSRKLSGRPRRRSTVLLSSTRPLT
jgi:hypothetical protein